MKLRVLVAGAAVSLSWAAHAAVLTVDGKSDIFRAGGNNNALNGIDPPVATFAAAANQVLAFQSVSGSWSCCSGGASFNGPDGGPFAGGSTNVTSSGKIAGIVDSSHTMFLVGLFLDASLPAAAPSRLDFSPLQLTETFSTLSPSLGQVFFIGDGLTGTGSGATQQFLVPGAATRLFLGVADSFNFTGAPSFYTDNVGSVTATFTITAQGGGGGGNGAPEPASLALLSLGVLSLSVVRRRNS